MHSELAELNRIREDEDRSYNNLAREVGLNDASVLHKVLNGKSTPSERTLRKIRRYLEGRQRPTSRRKSKTAA